MTLLYWESGAESLCPGPLNLQLPGRLHRSSVFGQPQALKHRRGHVIPSHGYPQDLKTIISPYTLSHSSFYPVTVIPWHQDVRATPQNNHRAQHYLHQRAAAAGPTHLSRIHRFPQATPPSSSPASTRPIPSPRILWRPGSQDEQPSRSSLPLPRAPGGENARTADGGAHVAERAVIPIPGARRLHVQRVEREH